MLEASVAFDVVSAVVVEAVEGTEGSLRSPTLDFSLYSFSDALVSDLEEAGIGAGFPQLALCLLTSGWRNGGMCTGE